MANGNYKKGKFHFVNLFSDLTRFDRHRSIRLGLPIADIYINIPFGYQRIKNEKYLQPIQKHFEVLVKAKEYLETVSWRELANWVTNETGEYVSFQGLMKIMEDRQPFDEAAEPLEQKLKKYATPKAQEEFRKEEETRTTHRHPDDGKGT